MLSVLCKAINPGVGLEETLRAWDGIASQLRENTRKRKRQLDVLESILS